MRKSEERIFEQFIKEYEKRTVKYLSSRYSVLPEEDIRDIMQDSYVVLHRNIEAKKQTEPHYPFFLRTCINLCLKAIGKQGKHIDVRIDETDTQQKNRVSMDRIERILQVGDEQEAVLREKQKLVREVLGEMATRCRELLWSYYADELSWAVIAGQCGLKNADTAKSYASRCRQTFKEKYNQIKTSFYGK